MPHTIRYQGSTEHRVPSTAHRAPSTQHRAPSTEVRRRPAERARRVTVGGVSIYDMTIGGRPSATDIPASQDGRGRACISRGRSIRRSGAPPEPPLPVTPLHTADNRERTPGRVRDPPARHWRRPCDNPRVSETTQNDGKAARDGRDDVRLREVSPDDTG